MADCTPEFWTLKQIRESLEKEYSGKKKIVIPMFQRGKRWDKDKKKTFIDSLRKRYPIGTLLFYRTVEGNQEIYTLIDGLQRGTAIREYLSYPSKFFEINEIHDSLELIYGLCEAHSIDKKKMVDETILDYIHKLPTYDDLETMGLYLKMIEVFPSLNGTDKMAKFAEILKPEITKIKRDYEALGTMQIPAIVYTGEENTLPEIFERINSKGVPLTEYEIYAASWPRKEFIIENSELIEYVLKKYDSLNDTEYSIKDYDREDKRINKKVNAFEYTFGLSKWLQNKYPSLNFYRNLKDDETNPVAFQLLNACFNTSHSQIKDVHQIIARFVENISILENNLVSSIEFVNQCIEPILKFKGNNRNKDGKIFHSQYQIMSYISFAFRQKYDITKNELPVREDWKEKEKILKANIWKYYVYDIIVKFWGEGGTGKIHTANSESRYLKELTKTQFANAYDSYTDSQRWRCENKCVSNPSDEDYVLLNAIYLHTFSAMDQLSLDKFDVEHIATKDQMKKLNKQTDGKGLPISHFANLCYLPEAANRSKGAKNFYQDTGYLSKSSNSLETIEMKYSFTKINDLEFMDLPYSTGDFDVLQTYYFEFIDKRNQIMKTKLLESLGFNMEEGKLEQNNQTDIVATFDEKYLRTTKIGELVKSCFDYLSKNNLLDENDVKNLCAKSYSSTLGTYLAILVTDENQTLDANGRRRYYLNPIRINDSDYYLCKEWVESNRKKVVEWFLSKKNK